MPGTKGNRSCGPARWSARSGPPVWLTTLSRISLKRRGRYESEAGWDRRWNYNLLVVHRGYEMMVLAVLYELLGDDFIQTDDQQATKLYIVWFTSYNNNKCLLNWGNLFTLDPGRFSSPKTGNYSLRCYQQALLFKSGMKLVQTSFFFCSAQNFPFAVLIFKYSSCNVHSIDSSTRRGSVFGVD